MPWDVVSPAVCVHVYITQSGSLPGPALGKSRLVDCCLGPDPLKPISEEDAVRDSETFLKLVTENIIIPYTIPGVPTVPSEWKEAKWSW